VSTTDVAIEGFAEVESAEVTLSFAADVLWGDPFRDEHCDSRSNKQIAMIAASR
jgi:hypothetical protein